MLIVAGTTGKWIKNILFYIFNPKNFMKQEDNKNLSSFIENGIGE